MALYHSVWLPLVALTLLCSREYGLSRRSRKAEKGIGSRRDGYGWPPLPPVGKCVTEDGFVGLRVVFLCKTYRDMPNQKNSCSLDLGLREHKPS